MAGFTSKHKNLEIVSVRFGQEALEHFEVLKLRGRNISQFIRVAVDRAIDQERGKG